MGKGNKIKISIVEKQNRGGLKAGKRIERQNKNIKKIKMEKEKEKETVHRDQLTGGNKIYE